MTPEKTDQPAEPQLLSDSDIEQVSGGLPSFGWLGPIVNRMWKEIVDWAD